MDTDRPSSYPLGPVDEAGRVHLDQAAEDRDHEADERDHVADMRDHDADQRESALDEREVRTAAVEAGIDARVDQACLVLADAARRDDSADARDTVADERERAASLDAFVHPNDQHDAAIKARRSSANDRLDSRSDRSSSAEDRSKLSDI
jgi:hypothetical protein